MATIRKLPREWNTEQAWYYSLHPRTTKFDITMAYPKAQIPHTTRWQGINGMNAKLFVETSACPWIWTFLIQMYAYIWHNLYISNIDFVPHASEVFTTIGRLLVRSNKFGKLGCSRKFSCIRTLTRYPVNSLKAPLLPFIGPIRTSSLWKNGTISSRIELWNNDVFSELVSWFLFQRKIPPLLCETWGWAPHRQTANGTAISVGLSISFQNTSSRFYATRAAKFQYSGCSSSSVA